MSNGIVKDSSIDCVFVNIRPSILEEERKNNLIITFEISSLKLDRLLMNQTDNKQKKLVYLIHLNTWN